MVTGGGGGMAPACAVALGEARAVVAVADLDPSLAAAGARAVQQAGGTAHGLPIDVTRTETVDAAVGAARGMATSPTAATP